MDLGLTEKVFVVTPATCGLGLATAGALLADQMIMDGPARAAAGTEHPEHQRYHVRRAGELLLQPCGTPDGLARAAAFVLSPAASSITGTVITSGEIRLHAG